MLKQQFVFPNWITAWISVQSWIRYPFSIKKPHVIGHVEKIWFKTLSNLKFCSSTSFNSFYRVRYGRFQKADFNIFCFYITCIRKWFLFYSFTGWKYYICLYFDRFPKFLKLSKIHNLFYFHRWECKDTLDGSRYVFTIAHDFWLQLL